LAVSKPLPRPCDHDFFYHPRVPGYQRLLTQPDFRLEGVEEELRQANEALDVHVQERTGALQTAYEALVMLRREVPHRVNNNFQVLSSLLSLQADAIKDAQARMALRDRQDRVHLMAMIHESLSQPQSKPRHDLRAHRHFW
jgi:two-component system, sensor histidine kinase PdtaS